MASPASFTLNLGSIDAECPNTPARHPLKRTNSTESSQEETPVAVGASWAHYLWHGFGICTIIGLAVLCLTLILKQHQMKEEMTQIIQGELKIFVLIFIIV